jgi:type II restriction/modification system DNA methylase subunit YeeA
MKEGGWVGFEQVDWFNGGLFDDDSAIPLDTDDLTLVERAADLNWSEIDTSIFGTLFERGLDPDKRSQLGAHYTDVDKIRLIVEPVITRPLLVEWVNIKSTLASLADTPPARRRGPRNQSSLAAAAYRSFLARLRAFRVLDPACGSGNFLYVALLALKDIERQVAIEAEAFGFEREFPHIGPEAVLGIEINPYAAELARVTVWIGEIQWMRRNGFNVSRDPILKPLNTIECRDAVLNDEGTEALWPDANVVIGNPPFLGAKLMKGRLGLEYTDRLRNAFRGRLAAFSDLVCFWFEKARQDLLSGRYERAGLVATSSIRGGTNRPVLDRICENLEIYDAHGELPWTVEGARVEVSIICFAKPADALTGKRLDGQMVEHINADLTAGIDLTTAKELPENRNVAFIGIQKTGPLDVPGELARTWMQLPTNPNGRENREILKPYYNGDDITGRVRDQWTIDFPLGLSENEASQFQTPFEYLRSSTYYVSKERPSVSFPEYRANTSGQNKSWWEPHRPRPAMRTRIESLSRYIVTPEVSEHRIFVWLQYPVLPDKNLIVITRDDDTTFGILQSRFHELWALRLGTSLEDRPRYTSTTTFATFPFPSGLNPNRAAGFYAADPGAIAIADAARRLDQLRQNWLYPTRQIRTVPEIVPGFPDRLLPADEASEALLKGLTLTALYNEKPTWLRNAHRDLDAAVAAAYGWSADISDDEALTHLLELNHERASAERPQDRRPAPQRLQREPELPPMPIPGGVPEQQPVPTEPPIAQPVAGRIRRRRSRSSG